MIWQGPRYPGHLSTQLHHEAIQRQVVLSDLKDVQSSLTVDIRWIYHILFTAFHQLSSLIIMWTRTHVDHKTPATAAVLLTSRLNVRFNFTSNYAHHSEVTSKIVPVKLHTNETHSSLPTSTRQSTSRISAHTVYWRVCWLNIPLMTEIEKDTRPSIQATRGRVHSRVKSSVRVSSSSDALS